MSVGLSLSAVPMISGTATTPAYMLSTCCSPYKNICGAGSTWSTGCFSVADERDLTFMT